MPEELEQYILEHCSREPEWLRHIYREANLRLVNGRMCSGHLQGRLLKMLVQMINPDKVLELGTFAGYSALCIAEGLKPGAKLLTIEAFDELESFLRESFSGSEYGSRIELKIGDALEVLFRQPDNSFDMAFVDADKREYPAYFIELKRIIRPGGYIVADNTLWDGHVIETDTKSQQTIGIKKFNDMVANDNDVEKVILPLRDGLTLIRLKE